MDIHIVTGIAVVPPNPNYHVHTMSLSAHNRDEAISIFINEWKMKFPLLPGPGAISTFILDTNMVEMTYGARVRLNS